MRETLTLDDGTVVGIRPIEPSDAGRLVAFHERLSSESQRLRFFSPHPHLQPREVQRFITVDGQRRVALVAEIDDDIVGVPRFDRIEETDDAEATLVVRDDLQGRGVGTALMERLVLEARRTGLRQLLAVTLPENARVRALFRQVEQGSSFKFDQGVIDVTIPLETS